MPAVEAIIDHGTIPSNSLEDETSLRVQSVTISGIREKREYLNASGATDGLEYRNPKISFAYDTQVTAYTGLPTYNPGQEVTSLANFADSTLGFSPGDGVMVMEEPTITRSNTDTDKMTFTVVQYPFVA